MKRPTLIFDLDGTLAHTAPDLIATLNRICKPYDLPPVGLADVGQIVGHGAMAMLERVFAINGKSLDPSMKEPLFQAFLIDYSNNIARFSHMFEGIEELLPHLVQDGHTLCVCTNKREDMARKLLIEFDLMQHFSSVTGGDSFKFRKPDPRHLCETVELAGGSMENAIMIGDSSTDINAAKNAGIPSIAVTFGYSDVPVKTLGAECVISTFHDLKAAISEIEFSPK